MRKLKNAVSKTLYILIIMLCIFVLLAYFWEDVLTTYSLHFVNPKIITDEPIIISEPLNNPANNVQNSKAELFPLDNKLHIFVKEYNGAVKSRYCDYLSSFSEGNLIRISKIKGIFLGQRNGYIYFYQTTDWKDHAIYSYNISENTTQFLISATTDQICDFQLTGEGYYAVPVDKTNTAYYTIYDSSIAETDVTDVGFSLNGKKYIVDNHSNNGDILCIDEEDRCIEVLETLPAGRKCIIPCSKGLLVHNEGQGNLLYLISKDGKISEMFSSPCVRSESAVNIYENYIYISVLRYRYDESSDSTVPYEGHECGGTYRISLNDYKIERLSDSVYTGLYVFDDTGIYACDANCNVYKLEFDGRVTQILLEH